MKTKKEEVEVEPKEIEDSLNLEEFEKALNTIIKYKSKIDDINQKLNKLINK